MEHISSSLHPDCHRTMELRGFVGGKQEDFFAVDVSRHFSKKKETRNA